MEEKLGFLEPFVDVVEWKSLQSFLVSLWLPKSHVFTPSIVEYLSSLLHEFLPNSTLEFNIHINYAIHKLKVNMNIYIQKRKGKTNI